MDLQHQLNKLLTEKLKNQDIDISVTSSYPQPRIEAISLQSLPGSSPTKTYMDGSYDSDVIFEVRIQTNDMKHADIIGWTIDEFLKDIEDDGLISEDNSFEFQKITVNSTPFLSDQGEDGYFTMLIDFTVSIFVQ